MDDPNVMIVTFEELKQVSGIPFVLNTDISFDRSAFCHLHSVMLIVTHTGPE